VTQKASVTRDHDTITVHLPLTFARRGGRKQIVLPDGAPPWVPLSARVNNSMVKAIARGFHWRKILETGVHATVEDIAAAEKINPSYVSRVLRLTLLAPSIVEAIVEGRQPSEITLAALMGPFPMVWKDQRAKFLN
jgi:hypothetical protein